MQWINKEHWDAEKEWQRKQMAALFDPELRDQQLRQIAKDLYYDKWTWNTMGGFDAEEHERIDKYIKELEDGDTQD